MTLVFPLTPGAYLKARRCAALLSIADVAERLATVPHLDAEHVRAEWVELIEADVAPLGPDTIAALHEVYPFDLVALRQLGEIAAGADIPAPNLCRVCACSWEDPCPASRGGPCVWTDGFRDYCDRCAPRVSSLAPAPAAAAQPAPGVAA